MHVNLQNLLLRFASDLFLLLLESLALFIVIITNITEMWVSSAF